VINSSLLGTDWYINQLRYKLNNSDPMDPIWSADKIEGAKRDVIYYAPRPGVDPEQYMDLYTMMKDYAGSDESAKIELRNGDTLNVYPTKKVTVPVDINLVRSNGTVNPEDSVVSELRFEIPKSALFKNDAAILNIIAANKWKRPIYFTSEYRELGFAAYLRQDGLTHRLVPVANGIVNNSWAYDKMMNKFTFGNANVKGVYFDEENRRHLNTIRLAYAQAAINLAENGRTDEAKKMLQKCDKNMLDENFGYGMVSRFQQHNYVSLQFLEACYKADDKALADKVSKSVKKDLEQQIIYYSNLSERMQDQFRNDSEQAANFLRGIQQIEKMYDSAIPKATEVPAPINNTPASPAPKQSGGSKK
jgi:hypothetical protein